MNTLTRSLLPGLILILSASTSLADAQTGQGYITGMISYYDDDKDRGVDDGVAGGQIGIGKAFHDNWNIEGFVASYRPDGINAGDQLEVGANLHFVMARGNRFKPYAFVGASYLDISTFPSRSDTDVGLSAGVGLLADIFGKSPVALRAEYRYRNDNLFSTRLNDQILSLGLQIPFGGKKAPPPPAVVEDPDSDGDGIKDSRDRCPGTPAGISVDGNGCPLDSDGDGVPDHQDNCPGTMRGVKVDANGCELDSDRDGVFDRNDKCPDTRAGAQVDVNGCEIMEEIRLPGVNFESNSDRLAGDDTSTLRDAAESLKRNPTITVEVAGHTDSDGAAEYNEGLSARRAATVRDFLISQGVSPARISTRGYGESQPIADNGTAAGKAQNRRVVLRITAR
jgi:OOP family OmpA-OmpF porin